MSTGAPWWAFLVTAGVAVIAVCVSLYSLLRTDKREIEKWKRDTATKAATSLLVASNNRSKWFSRAQLHEGPDIEYSSSEKLTEFYNEIEIHLSTLEICNIEKIYVAASNICSMHSSHEDALLLINHFAGHPMLNNFDHSMLAEYHRELIAAVQKNLKL